MKKIFSLMITSIMALVVLVGCRENNFPGAAYDSYYRALNDARKALVESQITEPAAFSKLTTEIAYTVEKDREYQVEFLYEEESGRVVTISDIQWRQSLMNKKEYRELLKANLTTTILELLDYYSLDSGRVVGLILQWKKRDFSGNVVRGFALCDFDGDGSWDYLTSDEDCFGILGFAETSEDKYPKRQVNEFCTISFISDSEIRELEDLSGDERIEFFEKIA